MIRLDGPTVPWDGLAQLECSSLQEGMKMDLLGYEGKTVVVAGAATGMGKAATELLLQQGAQVHALDIAPIDTPVKQAIKLDLSDEESIDQAVRQLPDKVDCLFSCAGISSIYLGRQFSSVHVNLVNFVGPRLLTELLIPRIPAGGAIAMIASMTASQWPKSLAKIDELLAQESFAAGKAWLEAHEHDPATIGGDPKLNNNYRFSKEATVVYVKRRSWALAERQIRINALSPGITETPMLPSFSAITGIDDPEMKVIWPGVGRISTALDQAKALLFLNSDLAGYVSGVDLLCDYGFRVKEQLGGETALQGIQAKRDG
ncbi:short-chain dehydrogenase/reductase SDR [Sphingobium chlorophenolicum L-1]|uniref:Short-chain dehydrogenase/reductase SDR n=1 Tax=Sphingobium chlorophenolicum L-1 TaxID=690566 RepID=F6F351_SPHCR|nr:SDR family oxidoreductase [Sphingobium chlorophenolicum]AEG50863.1 short-chain dehydrogenase/reductase SDR [Sphingobium chlorophenolicum L-1]